jgi:hypothetical protein
MCAMRNLRFPYVSPLKSDMATTYSWQFPFYIDLTSGKKNKSGHLNACFPEMLHDFIVSTWPHWGELENSMFLSSLASWPCFHLPPWGGGSHLRNRQSLRIQQIERFKVAVLSSGFNVGSKKLGQPHHKNLQTSEKSWEIRQYRLLGSIRAVERPSHLWRMSRTNLFLAGSSRDYSTDGRSAMGPTFHDTIGLSNGSEMFPAAIICKEIFAHKV